MIHPSRNRRNPSSCFSRTTTRRLRCEPLEDRRMLSVLFVDDDAASGGDGLAWGTAYQDLQDALSDAATLNADGDSGNDVDQIWIAEGTYKPSEPLEPGNFRSVSFSLVDGVTLYGGFLGTETTLEERDASAHETVLSGDIGTVGDAADNAYTVVYCGGSVAAGLDGVTVSGGNANGSDTGGHRETNHGGGIYNNGGTLTVINSTVSDNSTESGGGGIYNEGGTLAVMTSQISGNSGCWGGGIWNNGTLTVTNSIVSGNSAEWNGGAIRNVSGTLEVTSSEVSDNSAYWGGGICSNGTLTVTNGTFSGNSANAGGAINNEGAMAIVESTFSGNTADFGGGIWNSGTATLTNGTVSGNLASWGGGIENASSGMLTLANSILRDNSAQEGIGGGLRNLGGTVTIMSSAISRNSAGWGGGIENADGGTLALMNSTVLENSAEGGDGGGIRNLGGTATVMNSTVSGNSAGWGGGIENWHDGTFALSNCTLSGNSAESDGGGIRNVEGRMTLTNSTLAGNSAAYGGGLWNNDTLTLHNSILANNTASTGPDIQDYGTLSGSHNLIADGAGQTALVHGQNGNLVGTTANPIDPLFTRNPSDGGDGWGDDPTTPDIDESANDDYGDLGLQEGSPAVDAGGNALLPADEFDLDGDGDTAEPIPVDVIGNFRVCDGDGDEIETVDMGAREFYRYPIGIDDTFEIASDEVLAIPGSDLTANDLHAPGMTLHVIAVTPPPGLPGTLDFDGETVTFTTPAGFVGEAWFDYTVESDSGNRGTGTVTVHVVPIPGDLNLDGQVTSRDLDIIRAWWGMEVEPGNLTKGDPSGDGLVGSADLDTVRANWGRTAAAAAPLVQDARLQDSALAELYGPAEQEDADRDADSSDASPTGNAAEATWARALEAMGSTRKTEAKSVERRAAVDLIVTGMVR